MMPDVPSMRMQTCGFRKAIGRDFPYNAAFSIVCGVPSHPVSGSHSGDRDNEDPSPPMLDSAPASSALTQSTSQERPIVVRFAGDSGDGVQVLGGEFTKSSALAGHGLLTFPDFPAEIRAPAGTTFGVSAFQIQFGGDDVLTPGDEADVLIAFNPAALKTNLATAKAGALVIVDEGAFTKRGLEKAGYETSPIADGTLPGYRLLTIDITKRTEEAVADIGVGKKQAGRAKNFWALGLTFWLFNRDRAPTHTWLKQKFSRSPDALAANAAALDAGHAYGETMELTPEGVHVPPRATVPAGRAQTITGTDAMTLGLAAIAALSGLKLAYCSYPITPASAVLHGLARFKGKGVVTFQAEDEIAAATAAIGASFAGALGVTGSSGPGIALKAEALGLAVATELPLIVINVQRAGPSTGMPTKAEQADLFMALHGRHGEAPMPVLAPATPAECFDMMIEAGRIAIRYMTPVMVLSDAYIANAAELWTAPDVDALPDLPVVRTIAREGYHPFRRNPETLARPWAIPGMEGFEHRIGGIERSAKTGHISYDPDNHQEMTRLRAEKIARIAEQSAPIEIEAGADNGDLLVVGWGSTHGAIKTAVETLIDRGHAVSHLHLRRLNPFPRGLADVFGRFKRVAVVEMNAGQLCQMLRAEFLIPARSISQVTGQPFKVRALEDAFLAALAD